MKPGTALAVALTLVVFTAACGGTTSQPTDPQKTDAPIAVPEFGGGKADNYISTNAREFELTGTAHADAPEGLDELSDQERTQAIREAAEDRLSTVSSSIEDHIDSVVEEANGGDGEEGEYFIYARNNNAETEETDVVDGKIAVDFTLELVGSRDLARLVVAESSSGTTFDVEVKDYGEESGEMVTVDIGPTPSTDAFPKYDELFEDGIYDIAVHFGGDYNEERYDIETAKWAFQMLKEDGWHHESVESFEDLGLDSGPFTKQVTVEGEPVEARVYLYHANMDAEGEQAKLGEAMKTSFAERDVVIYSGHAGSNAGFILDYDPRYEIEPSEFEELPLADKYQIYVFDGCRTYRTYVQDLMENDNKTFETLDAVTTINTTPFSAGYQVIHEFVYWLTIADDQGRHFPMTWSTILQGVNTEDWDDVHYGVHGVDQDPKLNPHASEGVSCRTCDTQAECGGGGNYCLQMDGGGSACGVACATSAACGEGMECVPVTDNPDKFYIPKQCMPTRRQCGG